jgi:hypothetical protein
LSNIPARDYSYVMGDFNAPLAADGQLVKNRCGVPNANSSFLADFISSRDLVPLNAFFRQRLNRLPTFYGPNARITRLDWILCQSAHKNKTRKVLNIRPRCVPSDHSLLACDVDLRWQTFKKQPPFPLWADLRNPTTRCTFVQRVLNASTNPEESAEAFAAAVASAAEVLPKRTPHRPKALWDADKDIALARRHVQAAVDRNGHGSEQATRSLAQLQLVYADRSKHLIDKTVDEIQNAADSCRHRAAWKAINTLTKAQHCCRR